MNFKLSQLCTVLYDVSEFVQNVCPLTGLLTARATARQYVLHDYRQLTLVPYLGVGKLTHKHIAVCNYYITPVA